MMKKVIILMLGVLAVSSASAATLTDNFDNGINSNLWGTDAWQTSISGGYNVPVQMNAPDGSGRLQIAKNTEYSNVGLNSSFEYGLLSTFTLSGNFIMSVDFNLLNFPQADPAGYSDAVMSIKSADGTGFGIWRAADAWGGQLAGVAGGPQNHYGNAISDFQNEGKFLITRVGNTIEGSIDHGQGAIRLGSLTADWILEDVQCRLWIAQYVNSENNMRSLQSMDARFDNFYVLADEIIIPEPATLLLLGLGAVMLRRKRNC
jgi:hypothetical protein